MNDKLYWKLYRTKGHKEYIKFITQVLQTQIVLQ